MGIDMLHVLNKFFARFFIVFLCCCFISPLLAQEPEPENSGTAIKNTSGDVYRFEQNKSGMPVFTQVLRWTDSPGVLYYEVTLKTTSERVIFRNRRTDTAELEIQLEPGAYQYKVFAYNLLGALEQESEWIDVEIKQAHLPVIRSISPSRLYIEDEDFRFEVNGSGFSQDAEIYFQSASGLIRRNVKPISITDTKISFNFTNPEIFLGPVYRLIVKDKSGLQDISSDFIVKFRKPVDFYVGATYTPWSPLTDEWYLQLWNKKFYPLGFTGEVGLIFYKSAFGYIGTEFRTTYRKTVLDDSSTLVNDMKIDNSTFLFSLNLVYEWWFVRKCSLFLKAGAGVAWSLFYTEDSRKYFSLDPMYTVGLGLRVKPVKYLYIDIGLYLDQLLNTTTKPLGILPEIGIGFRY
ncbi:MAG: hypothetical protein IJU92_00540 [Spirochaetaceae bacterium]|nr:hypothetical protein [Spirochaetaceae bacterium]